MKVFGISKEKFEEAFAEFEAKDKIFDQSLTQFQQGEALGEAEAFALLKTIFEVKSFIDDERPVKEIVKDTNWSKYVAGIETGKITTIKKLAGKL